MEQTQDRDAQSKQTKSTQRWYRQSRALFHYLRAHVELRLLFTLLVIAAGVWLFLALGSEVAEGDTHAVDEALLLLLRNPADRSDPLGPPWVEEMMRDLTALGGTAVLMLVTVGVTFYLLMVRRLTMAWLVVLAVVGGALINIALKASYDRPRPDLVPHYTRLYHASFPSGHSMLAATIYLTLGVFLARLQKRRHMAVYVMGLAVLLTLLVGVSRVYLGAHWPTDVVAGWAAGAVWAAFSALMVWWLQQRWRAHRQRKALADIDPRSTEHERAVEGAKARQ